MTKERKIERLMVLKRGRTLERAIELLLEEQRVPQADWERQKKALTEALNSVPDIVIE